MRIIFPPQMLLTNFPCRIFLLSIFPVRIISSLWHYFPSSLFIHCFPPTEYISTADNCFNSECYRLLLSIKYLRYKLLPLQVNTQFQVPPPTNYFSRRVFSIRSSFRANYLLFRNIISCPISVLFFRVFSFQNIVFSQIMTSNINLSTVLMFRCYIEFFLACFP